MTLQEVWFASSWNVYTWLLPAALFAGVMLLVAINRIRHPLCRRALKILCALVFMFLCIGASGLSILEKWRIRHEWADRQDWNAFSWEEQTAITADGANLVMGPIFFGVGSSFLIFSATAVVMGIRRCNAESGRIRHRSEKRGRS